MKPAVTAFLRSEHRGWAIALPILVLGILDLLDSGTYWRGDIVLSMEKVGGSILFAGPLLAGAVAVDTSRARATSLWNLWPLATKGHRGTLGLILASLVPSLVAIIGLDVAAVVLGGPSVATLVRTQPLLAMVLHAAVLLWFSLLGLAVGRISSPALAGLSGVVVGYALTLVFGAGGIVGGSPLLDTGNAVAPQVGRAYIASSHLLRGLMLIALSAVAVMAHAWGLRRRGTLAAAVPILAIGLSLAPTALVDLPERRELTGLQPTDCADGRATRVCVVPEHSRMASQWLKELDELTAAASDAGFDSLVHPVLGEWLPGFTSQPIEAHPFIIDSESQLLGTADAAEWALSVLTPYTCLADLGPNEFPPPSFDRVLWRAATTWARLTDSSLHRGVKPLTPEQLAQVLSAWESCDLDHVP